MASVTDTITDLLREKDRRMRSGAETVRGMLAEVRDQIVAELRTVTGESYSGIYLRQNLASIERYLAGFESAASSEMGKILDAAWEDGADLVPAALRAGGFGVAFGHIPGPVLQSLKDFSFHKISGLTADAFTKIRGELSLGVLGQKNPHQVINAIAGGLDSPGVFKSLEERAEVIAQVEMGRAYSQASQISMGQAAAHLPELRKQWWHAGHPKSPRQSHLALHGQVQPIDRPFVTGSLAIDFPRAPGAPASEVIRCGCDHVPYHPAWGDDALPIRNERGEVIARRGSRDSDKTDLAGKFILGRVKPPVELG